MYDITKLEQIDYLPIVYQIALQAMIVTEWHLVKNATNPSVHGIQSSSASNPRLLENVPFGHGRCTGDPSGQYDPAGHGPHS